ncbi:hypothetical protein ACO0LF_31625 [Undibacterium sp. Di27W]|uniref:hypothetical protein n=1 Tax=Undibacterium sp. Di27W TaxID=3413036 RepID=UPI003BF238D4
MLTYLTNPASKAHPMASELSAISCHLKLNDAAIQAPYFPENLVAPIQPKKQKSQMPGCYFPNRTYDAQLPRIGISYLN